jgi:hypothetical protein
LLALVRGRHLHFVWNAARDLANDEGQPMQMHFEGSTKSEVIALADAWWRTQSGVTAILRVTQPIDEAEPPTRWRVVVHYEADVVEPLPFKAHAADESSVHESVARS